MKCDIYWGSHGCDQDLNHDGLHWCRSCCQSDSPSHMAHHATATPDQYGVDGCAGQWPYYGEVSMGLNGALPFFRYSEESGWQFEQLPEEFERMRRLHEARQG